MGGRRIRLFRRLAHKTHPKCAGVGPTACTGASAEKSVASDGASAIRANASGVTVKYKFLPPDSARGQRTNLARLCSDLGWLAHSAESHAAAHGCHRPSGPVG